MNCLSAPASTEVKQWIKVECFGQWTSYSIILLLIINVHESPCSCSGSRQHRVDPQPRAGTPRAGKKETLYQSVRFMHFWRTYMCMCVCFLCYYVIGTWFVNQFSQTPSTSLSSLATQTYPKKRSPKLWQIPLLQNIHSYPIAPCPLPSQGSHGRADACWSWDKF